MTISKKEILCNPIFLLAFGFGSGFAPKAPGTAGTLLAVLIHLILVNLPPWIHGTIIFAAFFIGIWICGRTAEYLGVHDHEGIVWDELVGYWLMMFLVPSNWLWVSFGFVLFRILDIFKPWPISVVDRQVGGGLGIMLDDLLAGVMGAVCIHALIVLSV
ncbi:MAG: phosphatidylglycerophosphatase A [Pseudohongiellaceae bacterium]|nr:phosphatidylglycerophosphatase A [Gammaproteobacteria bacterium]OUV76591.1 MAG: phosphatidylglycerophosphatase A [Gammaproteobacteria bacterium TMED139]|tara:strand:- start:769 stop:1245 length:477 start_codon:yes stop_codon:yes gene_type:complete